MKAPVPLLVIFTLPCAGLVAMAKLKEEPVACRVPLSAVFAGVVSVMSDTVGAPGGGGGRTTVMLTVATLESLAPSLAFQVKLSAPR